MASKKYTLAIGLLSLISSVAFAQTNNAGYNWSDSSKVSSKNLPQHNEFINNQYPYPAKQRDMWNFGIAGGLFTPIFDVPSKVLGGYQVGVYARKSLGYVVSAKIQAQVFNSRGQSYRPWTNADNLPGSVRAGYDNGGTRPWLSNYKLQGILPSAELIFSLKNLLFNGGNPKTNFYITVGYAPMGYKTKLNALNGSTPYNFNSINFAQARKDIISDVEDFMDGSYETDATQRPRSSIFGASGEGKLHWQHSGFVGAGFEALISNRFTLGLETKYHVTGDDYMDGYFLHRTGALTPNKDSYITSNIVIGFNIGNSAKRTIPKWFLNPFNYLYNEANRPTHTKFPDPVLPDADGDGVTDQFDMEPNTPQGAPVDSHGRAKDSDGDGVPDYKDKELLTSQKCFPVDADGVGNCPAPQCCTDLNNRIDSLIANGGVGTGAADCGIGNLPSVSFAPGSKTLSNAAKATLATAAAQIKANPNCNIKVVGSVGDAPTKARQQLAWDRVSAVINYLRDKQSISEDRFIFSYDGQGDINTVDLEGTTEAAGSTPARPGQ